MVASFLLGRRRFVFVMPDEEILDTNDECLIRRLSRLVDRKSSETAAPGRNVLAGRSGWIWPVMRWWRRVRAEGFLKAGGRGAWERAVSGWESEKNWAVGYHCVC